MHCGLGQKAGTARYGEPAPSHGASTNLKPALAGLGESRLRWRKPVGGGMAMRWQLPIRAPSARRDRIQLSLMHVASCTGNTGN
jgi:hypothetical protein